jgi:serine/threonine-protein kinase
VEPGTVLFGKYRVDEVIGAGGMGTVVRASHLYLQQPVAIKILLPEMVGSTETVSRFLREAQATVRLRSEHIARVMDVGTMPEGAPFIVMEYLDGNDLNQILRHHGPQTPAIVCDLMLQACEGMAEAHSLGIVHRDIKPSNFFVTRRPDGSMLLKILDFGISKHPVNVTELTGIDTVIGTPSYMSPEQMKSGRTADARSDIWSMGVVMYQLLAGRPPFAGESYASLVLQVSSEPPASMHVPLPAGLNDLILRCLEKDPRQRQQTVAELARMLAPYATDPIQAAQCAARTTRILQQKTSQGQQGSPLAAGGGRLTPVPISPAQLTPRSWPPSPSSTSLSHGRGQVTHRVRSGRGWMIAGITSLCAVAGAGGYIASEMRQDDGARRSDGAHVSAPPPSAAAPAPAPADPVPEIAKPAPRPPTITPKPEVAVTPAPTPTVAVKAAPTPTPAVAVKPVPRPTPTVAVKPAPAKATPTVAVKTTPKPAPKSTPRPVKPTKPTRPVKPKPADGLFDSRH